MVSVVLYQYNPTDIFSGRLIIWYFLNHLYRFLSDYFWDFYGSWWIWPSLLVLRRYNRISVVCGVQSQLVSVSGVSCWLVLLRKTTAVYLVLNVATGTSFLEVVIWYYWTTRCTIVSLVSTIVLVEWTISFLECYQHYTARIRSSLLVYTSWCCRTSAGLPGSMSATWTSFLERLIAHRPCYRLLLWLHFLISTHVLVGDISNISFLGCYCSYCPQDLDSLCGILQVLHSQI